MKLFKLIQAFLLYVVYFIITVASASSNLSDKTESNPFHLSWTKGQNRYDLVFSLHEPIRNNSRPTSDSTHFLTKALNNGCYNNSACLFENGTLIQLFGDDSSDVEHRTIFESKETFKPHVNESASSVQTSYLNSCSKRSQFIIFHYCSTHWNPPVYLMKSECSHSIEWHSPITCHRNATNQEHPCYIYSNEGKLIDLTSWILSDGSSYEVDTSILANSTIKKFSLNVCNEAHKACGPNVSSCFVDEKAGLQETGYNNLTSLKYLARQNATQLTILGQLNDQCPGLRVKTTVKFICISSSMAKPKLLKNTPCENIIEWESIHACPVDEIKVSAPTCHIKHNLLGIDLDLRKMAANHTSVEVENIKVEDKTMNMALGICQGLPVKDYTCEGQHKSSTSACLIEKDVGSKIETRDNSKIVGSITKSFIKLSDDRVYLESSAINKSCSVVKDKHFNITKAIGTRIEFYCSNQQDDKPKFLGYDDCTYVFEWGTPLLCFEHTRVDTSDAFASQASHTTEAAIEHHPFGEFPSSLSLPPVHFDETAEHLTPEEKHQATLNDTKKILDSSSSNQGSPTHSVTKDPLPLSDDLHRTNTTSKESSQSNSPNLVEVNKEQAKPKMNTLQKVFMIGLIVMSLSAFIVAIFILDKKTRLRVPIAAIRRRAGQAFQPAPVPYSRVDRFKDSLDL